jgi:predicted flap endonuclease-1-like 5' DNA nuclease
MEASMSEFWCCVWWFILGVLVGWLLSWVFGRCFCRRVVSDDADTDKNTAPSPLAGTQLAAINTREMADPERAQQLAVVAAAAVAGLKLKGLDDFEVIEGIGPKIAELLKNNGVLSFKDLSGMSIPELCAVLEKGGSRYQLANPETWAQQAQLACEGRWQELKALQDRLFAGTTVKPDAGV